MFDFDSILRRALEQAGDTDVAIAAPYELPERICRDLIAEGLARSIVFDSVQAADISDACAGWWIDRREGVIYLRLGKAGTLLLAGVPNDYQVPPLLLLEVRLKGVRRVVTTDACGAIIEDIEVAGALHRHLSSAQSRVPTRRQSYAAAFEALYDLVGDRLRLPANAFSRQRIVLCLGSLGPGGAERQGAYTAVGARQHGFEATVMCNHIAPPADFFLPYVENGGATAIRVPDLPEELELPDIRDIVAQLRRDFSSLAFEHVFVEMLRFASVLRSLRPALVHSWMDYSNVLCGTAAELVGVPGLVLSCRSLAPNHFRIFQPYMRPGYKALFARREPRLLNNSRAGADDYARWLEIDRNYIQVIHNGFEFPAAATADARARFRAEHGIAATAKVVGSVLRFSEEKRPQLLVDMAAEILAVDPDVRFLFFGGGVQLDAIRAQVRQRGLDHAIRLPGLTDATWNALAAMDLFTLASRMEGLPNVLVEAQAAGLPVVCTGVGGMRETYVEGQTGISVTEATGAALAQAAMSLLQNPKRLQKMSRKASAHARSEFGLRRMIDATMDTYERALLATRSHQTTVTA